MQAPHRTEASGEYVWSECAALFNFYFIPFPLFFFFVVEWFGALEGGKGSNTRNGAGQLEEADH